jgi:hypothetical protein
MALSQSNPSQGTESPEARAASLREEGNPFIVQEIEREAPPPPFGGMNQHIFPDDKGTRTEWRSCTLSLTCTTASSPQYSHPLITEENRIALPQSPPSTNTPFLPAPRVEMNDADALDCAAQSLEEAAAHQVDRKVQKMLLRKALKLRKKSSNMRGTNKPSPVRCILGGLVMCVTAPLYATGALIEGTGISLDASAMVLKGTGRGLKKCHTWTAEKMGF